MSSRSSPSWSVAEGHREENAGQADATRLVSPCAGRVQPPVVLAVPGAARLSPEWSGRSGAPHKAVRI